MARGVVIGRVRIAALAVLLWVWQAAPVAAHGTAFDGNPEHLMSDLLMSFGMPLLVLGIGALIGVALATWLGRGLPDEPESAPTDEAEPESRPALHGDG
jgi:hypothetical protein